MDFLHAIILGIVQGFTEFLPISSTAHLVITERFFGLDPGTFGLGFNAAIQLGTTVAVIFFFRHDLWNLVTKWRQPAERKLLGMLVIATIPALVAGLAFKSVIEDHLTTLPVIAVTFVVGGIIFILTERMARGRRRPDQTTYRDALVIGLAQCVAIIPGVSRSGSTIVPAMLLGLPRADAARFSFLLSVPVITAAGLYGTYHVAKQGAGGRLDLIAVGFLVSFVVGYFSIKYLLRYLAHHRLDVFAYYRFLAAAIIILVVVNS